MITLAIIIGSLAVAYAVFKGKAADIKIETSQYGAKLYCSRMNEEGDDFCEKRAEVIMGGQSLCGDCADQRIEDLLGIDFDTLTIPEDDEE